MYKIINNDSLLALEELEENSIDSIVTDPPYELNFMGKGWDNAGISFNKEIWQKCLRVLKPGGYLLAFGGSRTFHRIAVAIEDAGFEIRDTIMWLYGSGFPKSMNIGLAIDKKNGVESIDTGIQSPNARPNCNKTNTLYESGTVGKDFTIKKATNKWQGWGTCLKPSFEPVIVARKPFKGSLVDNILEYGVGGINIDECRVDFVNDEDYKITANKNQHEKFGTQPMTNNNVYGDYSMVQPKNYSATGRFPANTILTYDETDFDEVCGGFPNTSGGSYRKVARKRTGFKISGSENNIQEANSPDNYGDSGSASRYFYCAKASKKDRDEGLEGSKKNIHPTVKPTELMQYLIRLVTPKGGTILDPFMGSGSTGKAVMFENKERNADYSFIGIEREKEYCDIAEARISFASKYEIPKEEKNQISFADLLDG